MNELATFYLLTLIIFISSVLAVSLKKAMHSIIFLFSTLLCLAAIYGLINAYFAAIVQFTINVAAGLILFLFVIRTLNININTINPEKSRLTKNYFYCSR